MKKYLFILAASAALVACSKNELTPAASVADQEITYTVAPKVKAVTDFNTDWKFKATAFYLANKSTNDPKVTDQKWDDRKDTPSTYIDDVEISYDNAENVWRNADKKYYWPKDGKLTFFAYTSLQQTISEFDVEATEYGKESFANTSSYVSAAVDATNGVKFADYDVTDNKNVDLLVADIRKDEVKNLDGTYKVEGVPTLFRHKLSKVLFTAKTDQDYTDDTKNGNVYTFVINSIKFNNINSKGSYAQVASSTTTPAVTAGWTLDETATYVKEQTYYAKGTTGYTVPYVATGGTVKVIYADGNQYYYMPQKFVADPANNSSDSFTVNYTITTKNSAGAKVAEETVEATFPLNSTDANSTIFDEWKEGYKYTINLTFTLNEILWDPAVEEWIDASGSATIK